MRPVAAAAGLAAAALIGLAPAWAPQAAAQPEPAAPESAGGAGAPAELESRIAEVEARAAEWAARSREYEQARAEAPRHLEQIEAEIAALDAAPELRIEEGWPLEELESRLASGEGELAQARDQLAELEEESARRSERRKRIPELLAAAKERLETQGAAPPPAEAADPGTAEAWARLARARRAALQAEIQAYQNELGSYDARGKLLARRLDLANRRAARLGPRVEELRAALQSRRLVDAEQAAEQARQALDEAAALAPELGHAVRELAEQNARLAEQRTGTDGLLGKIEDVSGKLARAEARVAEIEADFANIARKVEAAGLSDSVGLLLRRQRSGAPEVGKYRRFIRMRQELIRSVQLRQLELRDERQQLSDLDAVVAQVTRRLDPSLPDRDRARIEDLVRGLLETRRQTLDSLISDYETYFQRLVDFDAAQQRLIDRTERLLAFIDERVLWIPSGRAVQPELLAQGLEALAWLFGPRYWGQLGRALVDVAGRAPLANAGVALLLLLSVSLARRAPPRIRELGDAARDASCTRYAPTAQALGLSLLLAPWLPGLLGYLGWQLGASPQATQFVRCIAHGMLAAALVWLSLAVPRQILRPDGLAEAHFGWPAEAVGNLRGHLGWLTALLVPATLVVFALEARDEDAWKESVGRVVFLVAMTGLALFTHRVMRERGGALARILAPSLAPGRRRWQWQLEHLIAVGVPVLLGAAALRGYYWTALELATRYHLTVVFLFALLVGFQLFVRWSLLAGRRAAAEQARERREAERARRSLEGEPAESGSPGGEPQLDLAQVTAQTGQLLRGGTLLALVLGLWLIWAEVFPAAGLLREVELWSQVRTVSVELTDADGETRPGTEQRVVPVTLADLLLALVIGAMALVLVRNLPGFLELSVMRRLGIGAGERYAYATIVKYGLAAAGIALALTTIGVGWSNIQWLVAAVGLGLGFGLQEIFANFISGLIILFERPIRVGDTVTVGEVSGTVTRIRIRATWITSFDRKELVVPNKEFVTGRLVNWSLSDAVLRVEIKVGIAYGSDTERAIEVLREVANRNEHVLREPAPQVLFLGFGDSSLSFELRVFSPDVSHLLAIRHGLHMEIDRAFREAGIEIAFPQRDLHLRSLPAPPELPAGRGDGDA